jgi:hypothetical protein
MLLIWSPTLAEAVGPTTADKLRLANRTAFLFGDGCDCGHGFTSKGKGPRCGPGIADGFVGSASSETRSATALRRPRTGTVRISDESRRRGARTLRALQGHNAGVEGAFASAGRHACGQRSGVCRRLLHIEPIFSAPGQGTAQSSLRRKALRNWF